MAADSSAWRSALVFVLACCVSLAACGGDDDDELPCVENLPTTCTPAFTPAWAGVYQNVIMPSCGANLGGSCHGSEGKKGDLEMTSSSGAYAALLGKDGTRARVIPKDPSCSILMERLTTSDEDKRMPYGTGRPLMPATICAIQQWIEQGAEP